MTQLGRTLIDQYLHRQLENEQRIANLERRPVGLTSQNVGLYHERILALPDLVAYWPMSDPGVPMLDLSGNNRPLTFESGAGGDLPTYEQPGPMPDTDHPYAVEFDGLSGIGAFDPEYVAAQDTAFDFDARSPFTWGALVNPSALNGGAIFGRAGGGADAFVFYLTATTGLPKLQRGSDVVTGSLSMNVSAWTLAIVSYDGTNVEFFFDGADAGTGTSTFVIGSVVLPVLRIGAFEFPGSGSKISFQGGVAHAFVLSSALDQSDAADLADSVEVPTIAALGMVPTVDSEGTVTWDYPTIEIEY